jgi:hypothetical protein
MESTDEKLIVLPTPHILAKTRQCRFLLGPKNVQMCRPRRSVIYTQRRGILKGVVFVMTQNVPVI